MNKPIKATQKITDSNSLLNKFIIYKFKDDIVIYYIYKVDETLLFYFNVHYISMLYCEHINLDIKGSLREFTNYNMYIF